MTSSVRQCARSQGSRLSATSIPGMGDRNQDEFYEYSKLGGIQVIRLIVNNVTTG